MSESGRGVDKPLRLTRDVREALLRANEGFTDSTYYSAPNFTESRSYKITNGELRVKSRSNTSWADSRQESDFAADEAVTHRFLREQLSRLDTEGVFEEAAAIKAARDAEGKIANLTASKPSDVGDVGVFTVDDDDDREDPSWAAVGATLVVGVALAAVAWVAPRADTAWQTKVKPKVEEWRARRSARHETRKVVPAQLKRPDDSEKAADDLE